MIGPELSGEKVNLRPLRNDDLQRRIEWLNDDETVRLFTGSSLARVYGATDAEQWRRVLEADQNAAVWAIETKDGCHIGDVDLHHIDRYDGTAKLTILIGDRESQSRGYGTDAIRTLMRHAFSNFGLTAIGLRVFDFNARAIRCYEKCGFVRSDEVIEDRWVSPRPDEIQMIMTKDRFRAEESECRHYTHLIA